MTAPDGVPIQAGKVASAIMEMLGAEGYRPKFDEDGDVLFKAEGLTYWYEASSDDDRWARLALQYRLADDVSPEDALRTANAINVRFKAVKTILFSGDESERFSGVGFTIESLFDEPERLAPVLARSIGLIQSASQEFFDDLRELADD